jgi:oxygen-dependent protoporphyrinogen oxidase
VKVAVVGAGMSGLTAAYRLQQAGHSVQVFEVGAVPGGRMGSVDAAGHRIDPGTHMLLENFTRTRALVAELGLDSQWFEVQGGEGGGVLHDHELASFSPKSAFDVLRFHGVPLRGRVRLLRAFLEARRHRGTLDFFDLSVGDDSLDDEDCDTYARRELGEEVADYVVDCFIRTFHFHGASKMSLKYFQALVALLLEHGDEFVSCALRGHMSMLPDALAAQLAVRYGAAVSQVLSAGTQISLSVGDEQLRFDAVVLATPAECALALLAEPAPAQRTLLAAARSSRTIFAAFEVPSALAGNFEGVWIPYVESQILSGLANDAPRTEGPRRSCAFSVWMHEEAALAHWDAPDELVFDVLRNEVARLFPRFAGALTPLHLKRWIHALPVYGVGQVSRVRDFWAQGQGEGGLWLCGDYLNHPWLEGAVRCGEKVAAAMLAKVEGQS